MHLTIVVLLLALLYPLRSHAQQSEKPSVRPAVYMYKFNNGREVFFTGSGAYLTKNRKSWMKVGTGNTDLHPRNNSLEQGRGSSKSYSGKDFEELTGGVYFGINRKTYVTFDNGSVIEVRSKEGALSLDSVNVLGSVKGGEFTYSLVQFGYGMNVYNGNTKKMSYQVIPETYIICSEGSYSSYPLSKNEPRVNIKYDKKNQALLLSSKNMSQRDFALAELKTSRPTKKIAVQSFSSLPEDFQNFIKGPKDELQPQSLAQSQTYVQPVLKDEDYDDHSDEDEDRSFRSRLYLQSLQRVKVRKASTLKSIKTEAQLVAKVAGIPYSRIVSTDYASTSELLELVELKLLNEPKTLVDVVFDSTENMSQFKDMVNLTNFVSLSADLKIGSGGGKIYWSLVDLSDSSKRSPSQFVTELSPCDWSLRAQAAKFNAGHIKQ
jgi:hypothetical protein